MFFKKREGFFDLYERHFNSIYEYAYCFVPDAATAEKLTENIFTRALEHYQKMGNKKVTSSVWLYKIATAVISEYPANLQNQTDTGECEGLLCLVKGLPFQEKQAVVLRCLLKLPLAEVCEIMDEPEDTVRGLLYQGLNTVKGRVE